MSTKRKLNSNNSPNKRSALQILEDQFVVPQAITKYVISDFLLPNKDEQKQRMQDVFASINAIGDDHKRFRFHLDHRSPGLWALKQYDSTYFVDNPRQKMKAVLHCLQYINWGDHSDWTLSIGYAHHEDFFIHPPRMMFREVLNELNLLQYDFPAKNNQVLPSDVRNFYLLREFEASGRFMAD